MPPETINPRFTDGGDCTIESSLPEQADEFPNGLGCIVCGRSEGELHLELVKDED